MARRRRHSIRLDLIPYPSTWINNRRWEDELEEAEDYGAGEIPAASASEEALPWI